MAKVVLHIGPHKTATSYVQAAFHHNRQTLAREGLTYISIGSSQAAHSLAGLWLTMPDLPAEFYGRRTPEQLWDDLISKHADGPGIVFLSSENFCRCHPEEIDMPALAQRLSAFDEVEIVYTMRRQVEMVPSIWAQIAKMRFVPSIWTFMRETLETRRAKGVPIDHNGFYDTLLKGFAPEQIRLLDYASFGQHPDGVVGVFLDLLGVDMAAGDLVRPSSDEANISPDPLALFVAGEVTGNKSQPPPSDLVSYLSKTLDGICGGPRTVLARHEYRKLRDRFGPGNATLVEKVQPHQPGFTFTSRNEPDNLFYRDDLDDKAWIEIARATYYMQSEQKPARRRSLP